MGLGVLIIGASASGKSTSMRNFNEDEVRILNVAGKPLPFRSKLRKVDNAKYKNIYAALKSNDHNCYVIDDANYLMAFESFRRSGESGFGKFTDMAWNFEKMLESISGTSDDTVVYVMMHPEQDEEGRVKPKTIGKMLDNQLCIEGLFSIVLYAEQDDDGHHFYSKKTGTPAKAPIGMFEEEQFENDLKAVDSAIREYYELAPAGMRSTNG